MIKWPSEILLGAVQRAQLGGEILVSKALKMFLLLELKKVSDQRNAEGSDLFRLTWQHEVRSRMEGKVGGESSRQNNR